MNGNVLIASGGHKKLYFLSPLAISAAFYYLPNTDICLSAERCFYFGTSRTLHAPFHTMKTKLELVAEAAIPPVWKDNCLERETIAIFNVTMKTPFNVGLSVTVVAACCRVGMWLEIIDQTYSPQIGLALVGGIGLIIVAGFRWLVESITKRL